MVLEKLKERRALALKRIGEMPSISLVRPMGALYLLSQDHSEKLDQRASSFLLDLARSESVAFTPGATFGIGAEGHFRGVFMAEPSILSEGMESLERFLRKNVS